VGAEQELTTAEQLDLLERIVHGAERTLVVIEADGTISWVNRAGERLTERTRDELIGHNIFEFVDPDEVPVLLESMAYAADASPDYRLRPMEFRLQNAHGEWRVVEAVTRNLLDDPVVRGFVVNIHDITDRRLIDAALNAIMANAPVVESIALVADLVEEQVRNCRTAIGLDPVGGTFTTTTGADLARDLIALATSQRQRDHVLPWQDAMATKLARFDRDLQGLPPDVARTANGLGYHAVWCVPMVLSSGEVQGCLVVWHGEPTSPSPGQRVSIDRAVQLSTIALERVRSEAMLLHAANHDTLTGVWNRSSFFRRLREVVRGARERDEHVALLFVDLDGFKPVNDRLGHLVGDAVLVETATRIASILRPDDMVARLGGDEFGVLCPGIRDSREIEAIADRLIRTVGEPIGVDGTTGRIGASLGIAFAADADHDEERLLDLADRAMYRAKEAGRHRWQRA
jgi:diguanylate cyclase (GGDEF)-like protein/PAS domain S-box-containing protein